MQFWSEINFLKKKHNWRSLWHFSGGYLESYLRTHKSSQVKLMAEGQQGFHLHASELEPKTFFEVLGLLYTRS